jgi:competence protein ComEC
MSERARHPLEDIQAPGFALPETASRVAGFVEAQVAAQADRAFLWLVVAFGGGIALFFTWPFDPPLWTGPGFILAGAALLGLRRRAAITLALALMMFGLGHGAAQLRSWVIDAPLLDHEIGPFPLRGQVVTAEKRPEGNHVVLENFVLPGLSAAETPRAVRITLPAAHGLPVVGQRMSVRAMVGPVGRPVAPDTFQFQRFLYFQGIGASGFAVGRWYPLTSSTEAQNGAGFHAWTESLRRAIGNRFSELVPGEDGTVAAALINGEQSAIPQPLQEAYRISGIAHILSVSGVHLSLLAGIVFFCIRRGLALSPSIALRVDTKKAAAWVSLMATASYLIISGMSVPAIRSFLMVATVLSAVLVDRRAISLRNVGWAALALMAVYPDAIFGASFQMSFIAVLSLVAVYEQSWAKTSLRKTDGGIDIPRALGFYVMGLVVADIVAGGGTAIFAAYHFNRLPTYSVFTNLVAAPLTSLWIMPAAVMALILMPFGLDGWAVRVMGEGVTLLDDLARWVATWPAAQVHIPPMPSAAMVAAAGGVIFLCLWKGRLRWLGFVPVIVAMTLPFLASVPDLLADDSGRVVAVSDDQGHLAIRPSRAGRFVRSVWGERYGVSEEQWPRFAKNTPTAVNEALGLTCDANGCVFERNGKRVLIAAKPEAVTAACGQVDAIVAQGEMGGRCGDAVVIDSVRLTRDGSHALWIRREGVRIRTAADSDGARIWNRTKESASDEASPPPQD